MAGGTMRTAQEVSWLPALLFFWANNFEQTAYNFPNDAARLPNHQTTHDAL